MFQTLRIWKWTAMVDQDYNDNFYKNLIDNWPWRRPLDRLSTWKWTYNRYGGKELLAVIRNRVWGSLRWHLHTRHQRWMKRELRMTYLEAAIWSTESLIRHYEERAEEAEREK